MLWKTHKKSTLAGNRNAYEDELFEHLRDSLPEGIRLTLFADRGFEDQARYQKLTERCLATQSCGPERRRRRQVYGKRFTIEKDLLRQQEWSSRYGPVGHAHPQRGAT